jgi:hypothetical protein
MLAAACRPVSQRIPLPRIRAVAAGATWLQVRRRRVAEVLHQGSSVILG